MAAKIEDELKIATPANKTRVSKNQLTYDRLKPSYEQVEYFYLISSSSLSHPYGEIGHDSNLRITENLKLAAFGEILQ